MESLNNDELFCIIDHLSYYDVWSLRNTCHKYRDCVDEYYRLKLGYDVITSDYFKLYLQERTDYNFTISLLETFNLLPKYVRDMIEFPRYVLDLQIHVKYIVDFILQILSSMCDQPELNMDLVTLLNSCLSNRMKNYVHKNILAEMILGTTDDVYGIYRYLYFVVENHFIAYGLFIFERMDLITDTMSHPDFVIDTMKYYNIDKKRRLKDIGM